MSALTLERRNQTDETVMLASKDGASVMLTPPIDEDYWEYRVKLSETQAIVGFPKFMTIGIGFAVEEDWNTNLPYTCDMEKIFSHIIDNKGDASISDDDVREAIRLVQRAAAEDRDARWEAGSYGAGKMHWFVHLMANGRTLKMATTKTGQYRRFASYESARRVAARLNEEGAR